MAKNVQSHTDSTNAHPQVICEAGAHLHYYEGGGMAFNSGVAAKPIKGDRGVFTAGQVMEELRPENVHFPNTALVSIENTCNRGGGRIYGFEEIEKLRSLCDEHGLAFHLDGARLFNAMVAEGRSPKEFGDLFDTVSICLSKGLGAPVGSLLLGKRELISKALRIRKVLGGGMRQAGYLAAAGLYALRNNIERLRSDHQLATALGECLEQLNYITGVLPVETNMIVFGLDEHVETSAFLAYLEQNGILAFEVGKHRIRFVTHLDLPGSTFEVVRQALRNYVPD